MNGAAARRRSGFGVLAKVFVMLCGTTLLCSAVFAEAPPAATTAATTSNPIEAMIVSGKVVDTMRSAGSASTVDADTIALTRAEHVHELLVRFPGVLVSRGSGEEHLTAIRSAVLSGAGSCGAFLFMEDGIPIRPHGLCNANGLFEALSEMAAGVDVVRGPGSAMFGGNALHGAINIRLPDAKALTAPRAFIEGGRWGFGQAQVSLPWHTGEQYLRLDLLGTRTDGYRDNTGFGEQKLSLVHDGSVGDWSVRNTLALTNLNQETGGFVLGRNAFRNSQLKDSNPNPEAFRDAWSSRLVSRWEQNGVTLTGYARRSHMRFLQHFLLGQPLEVNGQTSAGAIGDSRDTFDLLGHSLNYHIGVQGEWSTSDLAETQARPATGAPAAVAIRPTGVHYDYRVQSKLAAIFYDGQLHLTDDLTLVHSARLETLHYDYNNLASNGNLRADGTPCGFGGCLFNRVADRKDHFDNRAGRIGLRYEAGDSAVLHIVAASGFRPPQTTELYRLQRGQNIADLHSEKITSYELGWSQEFLQQTVRSDLVLFRQTKHNFIFRDAAGFNVSNGRTSGVGAEWELKIAPAAWPLQFELAATYARHRYEFNRNIGGGETIIKGNDEDTAPRKLGSARVVFTPMPTVTTELEMEYQGKYFADATNTATYAGHTLLNLRGRWQVAHNIELFARIMNLTDREYADRADLAFGNFRYFPGEPRRAFVGVQASL